jgi:CBS domain containing-hemolysin-like protein
MIVSAILFDSLWQILLMAILLFFSAFFSGSETAFFHLSRKTVHQYSLSPHRLERLVARILRDPNRFLAALLLVNLMVNILFFSISGTLLFQIGTRYGPAAGTATGTICFVIILLGGEMLPKSLAYGNARWFCLLSSPINYVILRTLSPVLIILDFIILRPTIRLFSGVHKTGAISINQLKFLLESSRRQGLISNDENQILMEILKLSYLKVRHVMTPSVEMRSFSSDVPPEKIKQRLLMNHRNCLPIYRNSIDDIIGVVYLKDILLNPQTPLSSLLQKVHFVPEQKTVESLIDFFRQFHINQAIVVDEYGGVAGLVELEDITDHLLGTVVETNDRNPIEPLGPLTYRLQANLSIYDWMESFGLDDFKDERLTTIGGFITAALGKIPKAGDQVKFKNMTFTVENITHNRIETVVLSLQPTMKHTSQKQT